MRFSLLLILATVFTTQFASAEVAIAPGAGGESGDLSANATIDQILDALDQRGQNLKEFTAKVSMTEGDASIGDQKTRSGNVSYRKLDNTDNGQIHVIFDTVKRNKIIKNEKLEYLLKDGWLTDRDYSKQTETRREVTKPGQKINLLKLGEGPFPLPIGQSREEVMKQFDVTLIPLDPKKDTGDLLNTIHVRLSPKEGTSFFRRFGSIDVWVNRSNRFPAQIKTRSANDNDPDKRTTRLEDVKINPPGGSKDDFTLPGIDGTQWSKHSEAYKE